MTLKKEEFDAVLSLPPAKLYAYFLNQVCLTNAIYFAKDSEALWFNYRGGECYPIWSHSQFLTAATAHLQTPELLPFSISVRDFVDDFVSPPYDDLWVAVMLKPDGEAYIIPFEMFRQDLIEKVLFDQLEEPPDLEALEPKASIEEQVRTIFRRNMKAKPKGKLPR